MSLNLCVLCASVRNKKSKISQCPHFLCVRKIILTQLNSAVIMKEMEGEAEKAGLHSDDDVVDMIMKMRYGEKVGRDALGAPFRDPLGAGVY